MSAEILTPTPEAPPQEPQPIHELIFQVFPQKQGEQGFPIRLKAPLHDPWLLLWLIENQLHAINTNHAQQVEQMMAVQQGDAGQVQQLAALKQLANRRIQ
jgi:hypothetical protein